MGLLICPLDLVPGFFCVTLRFLNSDNAVNILWSWTLVILCDDMQVPRMEKRVYTVAKLGYRMCIVPKVAEKALGTEGFEKMEVVGCRNLKDIINTVFPNLMRRSQWLVTDNIFVFIIHIFSLPVIKFSELEFYN